MTTRTASLSAPALPINSFQVEELLSREPILLNDDSIRDHVHGRRILITGASGSIGSEVARQIASYQPLELILVDRSETTLTALERDLTLRNRTLNINVQLADISDETRIRQIFNSAAPEIVYHAAALKHVPFVEKQHYDAVKTNILGTKILADISFQTGVEKFVYVSTDKAVNPSSVMGATKRFGEMIMAAQGEKTNSKTQFVTARFGNVLASSGSVVHLFQAQILAGGPITVTHKDMVRYFMTLHEAGQLLLEAGAVGKNGQVLIFKMGEPVFIIDLAAKMVSLHGLQPYSDIDITFTGARPGEKFYEELLGEDERLQPSHHPQIMTANLNSCSCAEIDEHIENLKNALLKPNTGHISDILMHAIPDYNAGIV